MTASHGVGVYGNGVGVTTPVDHKLGNAGLIAKATSSLAIRPGVFWGGADNIVTGTSGMTYNIAAFTAVLSRGGTSGAIPLANDGVVNVATTAAPGSNSRIDVVYVWQREFSIDGTDSNPVIGVVQGTAAASPSVPSLAAFPGAVALAQILVPAGVTATNTGTTFTQVAPFTATAGGLIMFRSATEQQAATLPQGTLSSIIGANGLYSSTGAAWVALTAGLIPVVPTSVVGGTLGLSGNVVYTAASTVSLNGVFTSVFDNYLMIVDNSAKSTGANLALRMRLAGTDESTSDYSSVRGFDNAAARTVTTQTAAQLELEAGVQGHTDIECRIYSPAKTIATAFRATAAAYPYGSDVTGSHSQATAYDGVTILPSGGGTMTGVIRVYGYNNN